MTSSAKSMLQKLKDRLLSLFVGRFTDAVYCFKIGHLGWQNDDSGKLRPLIYIIDRQHYKEFSRRYPVANISELKQVLAAEYEHESLVFYKIAKAEEHQRHVVAYVFNPDVLQRLKLPAFLLPESVVLAAAIGANQLAEVGDPRVDYFLFSSEDRIFSQRRGLLCQNIEVFKLAAGVPEHIDSRTISAAQLPDWLAKGLYALPLSTFGSFLKFPAVRTRQLPWRKVTITLAVFSLVYMVFISAYLTLSLDSRQDELNAMSSEMNQLMNTQQELEQVVALYNGALALVKQKQSTSPFWILLIDLIQNEQAELRSVSITGNQVLLRGTAERATDLLTIMAASPYVGKAEFQAPVTSQRNRENFVIALTIKADAQIMQQKASDEE